LHVRDLHGLKSQVRAYSYQRARTKEDRKLLGESAAIQALRDIVARAAETPHAPVLILGETGTGKELVAEAVHELSLRRDKPITKLNCSAIPPSLIESELFGYDRGAFTDAKTGKVGVFELADGGSIFLDEVGDLHPDVQPKLLRILEGHPFRRLGGTRDIRSDVRLIAATNRDLAALVKQGRFREDLYYRLKVITIEIPPLRARGDDVVLLAEAFAQQIARELKRGEKRFSTETRETLLAHPWPGNVRELRNVIERSMILCDGPVIELSHLPREIQEGALAARHRQHLAPADGMSLDAVERAHVFFVLEQVGGNKSEAARRLGISRNALKERLRRYGASDPLDPDSPSMNR
jgi:DNA-binding NtrC family response regulator